MTYAGTATLSMKIPWINAPGPSPSGIVYGRNSLFVSDVSMEGLTTIAQMDPSTGDVLRSFLSPSDAGFDGRGNPSDLTYARGHLFVSDVGTVGAGRVYEIAPDATKLYNTYSLPFRGGAIATDGTRLFVGDLDSSSMLVLAGPQQLRRTLANGLRPAGMVFDSTSNTLWAIDQIKTGLISQITTKGELLRTCAAPWSIGGFGVGGVALSGTKLWIAEVNGFDYYRYSVNPGTISIADAAKLTCSPALPVMVHLDIKPDSFPNVINPQNNGVVPVAILSTANFDASTINPTTLRFGETGKEAPPDHWTIADVNHDGRSDLIVHFRTRAADLSCGVTFASISGRTYKGQEVRGTDSIALVGCK